MKLQWPRMTTIFEAPLCIFQKLALSQTTLESMTGELNDRCPLLPFLLPWGKKTTFCSQNSYHTNMWYILTTFNFKLAGWIGQCCQTTFHGSGQTIIYSSPELRSHEAWDDCCVSYVSNFPSMAWKTDNNASLEQFHHLFNFFHGGFSGFEDFFVPYQPFGPTVFWHLQDLDPKKTMPTCLKEDIPKQCFSHRFATKKIPVSDRKQKFSLKILYKPKTLDARCIFHTTRHIYTKRSDTTN